MTSWGPFLREAIEFYRKEFKRWFNPEQQKRIREKALENSLLEPCQIEVLKWKKAKGAVLLLIHDDQLPDMVFKIHKAVESLDSSEFLAKYKRHFGLPIDLQEFMKEIPRVHDNLLVLTRKTINVYGGELPPPQELARSFLRSAQRVFKTEKIDDIGRSTKGLKKSIAKIPEKDIREELLANAKKIDSSTQEIRRMDEEINKMRQLVGVSQEYQDWKVLVSDVHRLKGEHVPREVFESKVKELSTKIEAFEKIEKAYERLSSRQEKVLEQQSSFLNWIKYSTILVPIAVACVPIIQELIRHYLSNL